MPALAGGTARLGPRVILLRDNCDNELLQVFFEAAG